MRVRKVVTVFGFIGAIALAQNLLMVPTAGAEPNWDAMAQCESGGNWAADTGNGFYGGLRFHSRHVGFPWGHRITRHGEPRGADSRRHCQTCCRLKASAPGPSAGAPSARPQEPAAR